MSQAVEAHGGQVDMVLSDGLMAVFGLETTREKASRAAILAARDMLRAVRALNLELGSAIPMPVRVGIGIHVGPVIVAENHSASGAAVNALGETVSIASRLEAATKEVLADCLVSVEAAEAAAAQFGAAARREIHVRGQDAPIAAYALTDGQDIEIGSGPKRAGALETVVS